MEQVSGLKLAIIKKLHLCSPDLASELDSWEQSASKAAELAVAVNNLGAGKACIKLYLQERSGQGSVIATSIAHIELAEGIYIERIWNVNCLDFGKCN